MANEDENGTDETRPDASDEATGTESDPSRDPANGRSDEPSDQRVHPGGEGSDTATSDGGSPDPSREVAPDEQYCPSCGSVVKQQAEICPECGVRLRDPPGSEKNAGLAAVLSFIFTGLGQIYNGQVGKGIALIVIQFVNVLLMFVLVGLLTYPIVWIYAIYDAYVSAERINDGEISP